MDLLTTYTHDPELQTLTTPSLISTFYKTLHAKSSSTYIDFTIRCLVTNLKNGDSSTSVVTPLPAG
jgi:hypothetical protein